jgi:hypothetical protein
MERLSTLKLVKKLARSVEAPGTIYTDELDQYERFYMKVMIAPDTDELCISKKAGKEKIKVKGSGVFSSCESVDVRFGGNTEFDSYVCLVPMNKNGKEIFSGEATRGFLFYPMLDHVSREDMGVILYYSSKDDEKRVFAMASARTGFDDKVFTLMTSEEPTVKTVFGITSITAELQQSFGQSRNLRFKDRELDYLLAGSRKAAKAKHKKASDKIKKKIKRSLPDDNFGQRIDSSLYDDTGIDDGCVDEAKELYVRCGTEGEW